MALKEWNLNTACKSNSKLLVLEYFHILHVFYFHSVTSWRQNIAQILLNLVTSYFADYLLHQSQSSTQSNNWVAEKLSNSPSAHRSFLFTQGSEFLTDKNTCTPPAAAAQCGRHFVSPEGFQGSSSLFWCKKTLYNQPTVKTSNTVITDIVNYVLDSFLPHLNVITWWVIFIYSFLFSVMVQL